MCTAISYQGGTGHYFGRNLDLEFTYREQVAVTPRNYPFHLRSGLKLTQHYAMIGMATMSAGYPLYYEAVNERGLGIAGLNFPGNAVYHCKACGKQNIAPFELIPWILGQCANVAEAKKLLFNLNVWNLPYSRAFPLTPLHWMIADGESAITLEPLAEGLKIYDNPVGVLTNNPPFPCQLYRLADHMALTPEQPENRMTGQSLPLYSNGMGAMGLPGDFSSASRFVKAAFVKEHSASGSEDVGQFFHILASVSMPRGSVKVNGQDEITQYSCCCDTQNGVYYYTTYDNSRIAAVNLNHCPLSDDQVMTWPLRKAPDIRYEN